MASTNRTGISPQTEHSVKPGPIAWFAANPVAANLLMLFLIAGGIISGTNLAIQHVPPLELRTILVIVPFPGASPEEVQEDVVRRVEESVVGLAGVEQVTGSAQEGRGRVDIELSTFADVESVFDDVQNAVDSIENFPPLNAERPEVTNIEFAVEIITLAVSSSAVSEHELRLAAENLRDELLELPAISQVRLRGARDREISVELSEEELRRHNLTFNEISNAIQRASLNLTSGELYTESGGIVLQTVSKRRHGDEFKNIPVITRDDGTIVTLGEIAEIRDGFVDEQIVTRVDGVPTVLVRVNATDTQSIVELGREVKNWMADYQPPSNIEVGIWRDRAQPALDRFSDIFRNGVIGAMLVFLMLILLFDLRIATWVTVGIPLSFIGAFLFFGPAGLSLNVGTLLGLFLMIGIVVDDAVVVGESIAAERESRENSLEAAILGARAVVGPITVGVITTVLAFLPFLFVTSPSYQIIKVFPFVAVFVLLVSLIEAFFILPAHLSHAKPWSISPLFDIQTRLRGWLNGVRDRNVASAVSWSVRNVFVTIAAGVAVFAVAIALLWSEVVRFVIWDPSNSDSGEIQANLELPVGAPFDATLVAAERFARAAEVVNEQLEGNAVQSISIMVGEFVSSGYADKEPRQGSHRASVRLRLSDESFRTDSASDIQNRWRLQVGDVSYLEDVSFQTSRYEERPTISYALKHDDPAVLALAVEDMQSYLAEIVGVYGISDGLTPGKRNFEIELTELGKAAGLTPALLGKQLRANFNGAEVQRIQRGRDEIKVVVRYPTERRRSLKELANERIIVRPQRDGRGDRGYTEIPLSAVARLVESRGPATLTRIDGKPSVIVSASSDHAKITPLQVRRQVNNELLPRLVEAYPDLKVEAHGSERANRATLRMLGVMFPIALIAMYGLMAGFLRSYWKPLVAVLGIPIGFAGAVLGHWVLGWDFTIMSLFGVIGVAGVIVNDSLILMDRYNTIRRENESVPAIAAISAATRVRFRAVFLTSLSTVLGLSPLLYERSDELAFMVPMIVSILGGLVLSGMFILFMLPALVMIAEGRNE